MTQQPQTLGIVLGGASVEHTISIRSARAVMTAARRNRWRLLPLLVSPSGRWLTTDQSRAALEAIQQGAPEVVPEPADASRSPLPPATIAALLQCDAVFPLIHGTSGEDGTLQGFLETLDLPYVGSGVAASAIAMDKARAKQLLAAAGIPVAPGLTITCEEWRTDPTLAVRRAAELDYPQFVKPSRGGSSIGISRVETREDAVTAIGSAFAVDSEILVEQAMPNARELVCGVLGSLNGEPPIVSPPGEIRTQRDFYDFTAKYEDPATQLITPANLDPALAHQLQQRALDAWRVIGAEGMVRADFLLGEDGEIWLGELNTIPGFTSASMYPRLFEVQGIPLADLTDRLLDLAFERHRRVSSQRPSGAPRA